MRFSFLGRRNERVEDRRSRKKYAELISPRAFSTLSTTCRKSYGNLGLEPLREDRCSRTSKSVKRNTTDSKDLPHLRRTGIAFGMQGIRDTAPPDAAGKRLPL